MDADPTPTCLCTLDEALDGHRHRCPVHKKLYPNCGECATEDEEDRRWEEIFDKEDN